MSVRKHFFESLERENDYQYEYEKLEAFCAEKYGDYYGETSINQWIESNFRLWRRRSNYYSFAELRDYLGFHIEGGISVYKLSAHDVDLNKYLLFAEMILNLIYDLKARCDHRLNSVIQAMNGTIAATIEKAGLELRNINDELVIVEKNAVAISVADSNPELASVIIEYNHYLLHGDIKKKRLLLKQIADALEPKDKELKGICKGMVDDFFFLVNRMNIRHNNCDPSDKKNYTAQFAELTNEEKEKWYDTIYDQALTLFVLLDQKSRTHIINQFRNSIIA